jgi:ABC-type enterobactin transport system permease subunit
VDDPKRQVWMYLIVGPLAIAAAIYFLASDNGTTGDFSLLDWAILGMGIVALYRGVRMYLELRKRDSTLPGAGESQTFRRKLPRPGGGEPKD